jgi:hypothetical protein
MTHQQISPQHPQVVLRSRYVQLRALLALAAITVLCLTAAVVVLAIEDDSSSPLATGTTVTAPAPYDTVSVMPGVRYDGGPEEGIHSTTRVAATSTTTRYDGGPEEGSRGVHSDPMPAGTRYDNGPDEGTRGVHSDPMPAGTRYDNGPDEGTRGPGH